MPKKGDFPMSEPLFTPDRVEKLEGWNSGKDVRDLLQARRELVEALQRCEMGIRVLMTMTDVAGMTKAAEVSGEVLDQTKSALRNAGVPEASGKRARASMVCVNERGEVVTTREIAETILNWESDKGRGPSVSMLKQLARDFLAQQEAEWEWGYRNGEFRFLCESREWAESAVAVPDSGRKLLRRRKAGEWEEFRPCAIDCRKSNDKTQP